MTDLILIILIFGLLLVDLVIIGRGLIEIRKLNRKIKYLDELSLNMAEFIKVSESHIDHIYTCVTNLSEAVVSRDDKKEYLQ